MKLRDRNGQAGIEFMVVMIVLFFFLFFFLSLSVLLIVSDYIEYATFMTARTYKAYALNQDAQEEHARRVFDSYFNKIRGIARNPALTFVSTNPDDPQTAGVLASYDIDLFYLPPLFIGNEIPGSRLRLTSEAHLGREPSFEECKSFFRQTASQLFGISDEGLAEKMEDNGC